MLMLMIMPTLMLMLMVMPIPTAMLGIGLYALRRQSARISMRILERRRGRGGGWFPQPLAPRWILFFGYCLYACMALDVVMQPIHGL